MDDRIRRPLRPRRRVQRRSSAGRAVVERRSRTIGDRGERGRAGLNGVSVIEALKTVPRVSASDSGS